jgi:hypothetical protein
MSAQPKKPAPTVPVSELGRRCDEKATALAKNLKIPKARATKLLLVAELLENAAAHLRADYAGACWRAADALGLLAELYPKAIGVRTATGRGNKLEASA